MMKSAFSDINVLVVISILLGSYVFAEILFMFGIYDREYCSNLKLVMQILGCILYGAMVYISRKSIFLRN